MGRAPGDLGRATALRARSSAASRSASEPRRDQSRRVSFTSSSSAVTVNGSDDLCVDDWSSGAFAGDIDWAFERGITAGCGADLFCTNNPVTRQQMASFLVRALGLPPTPEDFFADDEGSVHEGDINRLAQAGVTGGCATERFCPRGTVTREQMASFLARALELPSATKDFFSDDDASPHEGDINRMAQAGITGGCAVDRFCPRGTVTREQMAAFLHRALGG